LDEVGNDLPNDSVDIKKKSTNKKKNELFGSGF